MSCHAPRWIITANFNKTASAEDYEECIDESVLPVVEAGQAVLVGDDFALDDEVWIDPLPGHTPGPLWRSSALQGARRPS